MKDRCWEDCPEIRRRFDIVSFVTQDQDPLSLSASGVYADTEEGIRQDLGHCIAGPLPSGIAEKNGPLHKLANLARVAAGREALPPREVQLYTCGAIALEGAAATDSIAAAAPLADLA